jgi:hypothetical protein
VPFVESGHYYEKALRKPDGSTNKGAFGRAVRILPESEYNFILTAGFAHALGRTERLRPSIANDYRLLVSRNRIPEVARRLLPSDGHVVLPTRPELRPHSSFLQFHRENIFKG